MESEKLISLEQYYKIFPEQTTEAQIVRAGNVIMALNFYCPRYGIAKDSFNEFFATIAHESGGFKHKKESLNYSTPQRLMQIWPSRFPELIDAYPYVKNPEGLAEKVYGGRLGNTKEGDGSEFIGRGFIMITGKDLYSKFATYTKRPLEEIVERLEISDGTAVESACWVFAIEKNCIPLALDKNFRAITLKINGGYTNMPDRLRLYELCKKYIN